MEQPQLTEPDPTSQPYLARRQNWCNQLARHALMQPGATALRHLGKTTTWGELDQRVSALANALHRRGVTSGDRVLILMLNRNEFIESFLAINKLGAIAVPVNFRMTPAEIAYLVSDCQARIVITEAVLAGVATAVRDIDPTLTTVIVAGGATEQGVLGYDDLLAETGEQAPLVDIPNDSPALIMYTSGTTGKPKGAVLTHTNIYGQAMTMMFTSGADINNDVGFIGVPLFHIAGIGNMIPGLLLGRPTVVYPLGAFDPDELLDVLEAEGVTGIFLVPAQWQAVCIAQKARPRNLKLRTLSWGAAPASDTLLREMAETFPGSQILAAFGQTEMSPVTCMLLGDDAIRKLGSVGKVIPTVSARIVDEDMNDVPVGEVGEIVYRAPTLMAGYWNNPKATAEAFEGGWFHSGDLVRQDEEGYIWVVDRKKDMIISGGENIYCAEVENALAAHPAIAEVAVIGRRHEKWGEVPVAVVALDPTQKTDLDLAELDGFLNERLARYKHPKALEIVDALPRNPAGKVLKTELRERFGAG
ncbi:long-chain-fatty-acid--CoA ligase [Mycolicibacterium phlei]|jgi:fatty-acyl-CoA synthase|uniref:Long-chain-fatty-acid--CoA ligase FadD13 n=2 Tax=Mycolicibacterium phlei TaxID=1771 RepID=A0A5N5UY30_MYCPH|nr:fatty-acid--CoA ligase FadD5 [Mycolicibacterium phlei]KXW59979.1 long-chain fatty acid--CoA ligase [Mycolicibacterium phlei DSM 43070]KXW72392.1 long-chain fatty acid--CoA ligase [Mycolicibacterium phlei DSM 43072]VEG07071.1 long-chain-fatty-acid--CoA ligase [Mycobacteroides chelonae]AMO58939.1 Long-chain-fatty-acid--CoA ligase FadD13 [Mycolicibacterium phlei]EID09435.1 long-chain-fatty-acid--CoA ligase [Mycolicibacterium phlei RIVM601174]